MSKIGHNSGDDVLETSDEGVKNAAAEQLRLFIERIERLNEEVKGIQDDKKDVFSEAKANGYDVKTMRTIIALRKMDKDARDEMDALVETYRANLGL